MGSVSLINQWEKPSAKPNGYFLFILLFVVALNFTSLDSLAQSGDSPENSGRLSDHVYEIIEDSSLHPGVASAWTVGRQILADGDVEEALSYLNYAYRTLPDVVLIAMDYQDALVRGGFVQDAVKVMDKLVGDYPDSLQWRIRRSSLNLRLGESGKALNDLKFLRKKNHSSAQRNSKRKRKRRRTTAFFSPISPNPSCPEPRASVSRSSCCTRPRGTW